VIDCLPIQADAGENDAVDPPAVKSPPAAAASEASAEREWQRLCDKYLPVLPRGSIWRFSRKRSRNDLSQGWKIHVSATILSACDIFRSVAPYLKKRDVLFKATKSLAELQKLNAGIVYGFSQVGKFITIYPKSTESAIVMARELHALTAGHAAPIIPHDNRLHGNSCVYYRYGGFSKRDVIFRKKKVPAVLRSDGKLVRDLRKPGTAVPPWLTDPFQPMHGRAAREALTPLETGYSNYEALVQRGKGGVYLALDHSFVPPKPCVIKEGRRHGETDWYGRDGFSRIKREALFLKQTSSVLASVPRVLNNFQANGCFYLVTERIPGRSLQQVIASRERISTRRILNYSKNMAQIVADIHAAGWAWRDCKPDNFYCQKDHELRALDFEGACRFRKLEPAGLTTSGYFPRKFRSKNRDLEATDLYALGTSIMQLFARSSSPMKLGPAFEREIRKRKLPRLIAESVRNLRKAKSIVQLSARATQRLLENGLKRKRRNAPISAGGGDCPAVRAPKRSTSAETRRQSSCPRLQDCIRHERWLVPKHSCNH
jgi:tRNA A-37 threonylcarbamoyl transferase component Bud32